MIPTPFETTGAKPTIAAEEQFYSDLVTDAGSRVSRAVIGVDSGSFDIHAISVGYPTAPAITLAPPASTEPSTATVVIGGHHGNEPSGRIAAMQLLRDFAYTTDPTLTAYLSAHPMFFVPTQNPWGSYNNTRDALDGDPNRDYLALDIPNARAVAALLMSVRPEVAVDLHETTRVGRLLYGGVITPQAHPDFVTLGDAFIADMIAAIQTEYAFTPVLYNITDPTELHPFRSHAPLRHILGLLLETSNRPEFTLAHRVDLHYSAVMSYLSSHTSRGIAVQSAITASRQRALTDGASGGAYILGDETLTPMPTHYRVTAAQWEQLETHRNLMNITGQPSGDAWVIPMAQDSQPFIPLIVDSRSYAAVVAGEPIYQPTVTRRRGASVVGLL